MNASEAVYTTPNAPYASAENYGFNAGVDQGVYVDAETGVPKSELGFDDKSIRRGFVRKALLCCMYNLTNIIIRVEAFTECRTLAF